MTDKVKRAILTGIGVAIIFVDATNQLISMLLDGALVGLAYLALKLQSWGSEKS